MSDEKRSVEVKVVLSVPVDIPEEQVREGVESTLEHEFYIAGGTFPSYLRVKVDSVVIVPKS